MLAESRPPSSSRDRLARALVRLSFLVVTAGALAAVALYEVVAIYRLPAALCAMVGLGALGHRLLPPRLRAATSRRLRGGRNPGIALERLERPAGRVPLDEPERDPL